MLFISIVCILLVNIFFLILALSSKVISRKKLKMIFAMLVACIGFVAYSIEPHKGTDLYRYFEIVDFFKTHTLKEGYLFIGSDYFSITGSLFDVLLYVVGKIGNSHFLPMIVSILYYSIVYYIILDFSKEQKVNGMILFIAYVFNIALTFIPMNLSGLRFPLASAIICLALYQDLYNKKHGFIVILLYAVAVAVHLFVIPFLIIRVVINRIKNKFVYLFLIFWSIGGAVLGGLMEKFPSRVISYIGYKLNYYFLNNKMWDYSLVFFITLMILFLIFQSFKHITLIDSEYKRMMFLSLLFVFGGLASFQIIARYAYIIACFGIPYVMHLAMNEETVSSVSVRNITFSKLFILLISLVLIFLQLRIINVIYLKEMDWIW